MTDRFDAAELFQGIILYGLNTATYKMALALSLLKLAKAGATRVRWESLSREFLQQYQARLAANQRPQHSIPGRLTVMERVVGQLNAGSLDEQEALDLVGSKGLENVIPRFQTIGRDTGLVSKCFYEFDFGGELILKDELLKVCSDQEETLREEITARWSLLEGAFTISQSQFQLANDIRHIYLTNATQRQPLTPNIPFLSGYQGGACFYCGERLGDGIHVDHVLPRQVLMHDEAWNLVLAHPDCNLLKSDKLVGEHFIVKLIARNENIMGSNHPWKSKISAALGKTPRERSSALRLHYENVASVLGRNYWGGTSDYNPASDPFYRRLITAINNPGLMT